MSEYYDVIIVGGGILGCATAFSLARRKAGRILLIERTTLGAQTTSRAAALITRSRSHTEDRALIAKTRWAMDILQEEYGEDIPFNRVGSLHVAQSSESAAALDVAMRDISEEGVDFNWLSRDQACEKTGWLNLSSFEAAAYVPDDGYVDPYILCAAYARAAKAEGIDILQGEEVIDLTSQQVLTKTQVYRCDQVVVTTGPWMNLLMGRAPLAPVRSQYWITAVHDSIKPDGPVTVLPDAKAYARPEVGGLLFGIRDDEAVYSSPKDLPKELSGFSFNEDYEGWESLERSIEPFLERCPLLETHEISHYISGPSSYTPDGQFVIGSMRNVIVAGGACGAGVSISGGVGELVADIVVQGHATPSRYDPNRFGGLDGFDDDFLLKCAKSRALKRAG